MDTTIHVRIVGVGAVTDTELVKVYVSPDYQVEL